MDSNPIISFCIKSYNQRQFIGEALRGAFAQTYSPLEIVISDNHSTDGSDELIRSMIEDYKKSGGTHTVIYNRNETNIGLMRNAEMLYKLCHGELLIQADGDDISLPNRTEVIAREWIRNGKQATLVSSDFYQISVSGALIEKEWWKVTIRNPIGAAMAYAKSVVKGSFPEITEFDAYDDNVFVRRAYALGGALFIKEKLVNYRIGAGTTSIGDYASQRQRISKGMICAARQNLLDIEAIKDEMTKDRYGEIRDMALEIIDAYGVEYGYNPFRKVKCYLRWCRWHNVRAFSMKNFVCNFLFLGYPTLRCAYMSVKSILGKA